MAHKYEFERIQEILTEALESHWPPLLESWDKVSEQMRQLQDMHKGMLANPGAFHQTYYSICRHFDTSRQHPSSYFCIKLT